MHFYWVVVLGFTSQTFFFFRWKVEFSGEGMFGPSSDENWWSLSYDDVDGEPNNVQDSPHDARALRELSRVVSVCPRWTHNLAATDPRLHDDSRLDTTDLSFYPLASFLATSRVWYAQQKPNGDGLVVNTMD